MGDVQLEALKPGERWVRILRSSVIHSWGRVTVSSGTVQLEVSHLGYANWETGNFALASDVVLDVEVKLGTEAIPLDQSGGGIPSMTCFRLS